MYTQILYIIYGNMRKVIIWTKFNNDKRRRDMVVGMVSAHLCLNMSYYPTTKELKFSVEQSRIG